MTLIERVKHLPHAQDRSPVIARRNTTSSAASLITGTRAARRHRSGSRLHRRIADRSKPAVHRHRSRTARRRPGRRSVRVRRRDRRRLHVSFVVDALAPTFGAEGQRAHVQGGGVLRNTPAPGGWRVPDASGRRRARGAPRVIRCMLLYLELAEPDEASQDKAIGYTAVVVVCAIVATFVVTAVAGAVGAVGVAGTGASADLLSRVTGGGTVSGTSSGSSSSSEVQFDKNSTLGELQESGKHVRREQ